METNNTENTPRACEMIKERALSAVRKAKPFLDVIIPLLILLIGVGLVLIFRRNDTLAVDSNQKS